MRKHLLLIALVATSYVSFSQTIGENERINFRNCVRKFLNESDWTHISPEVAFGSAPSSAFVCLLSIDSLGYVAKVTVLSDTKNQDSIFAIINRITTETFGAWRSLASKSKTVAIPIAFAHPKNKPDYVKAFIVNGLKAGEYGDLIVMPRIVFGWSKGYNDFFD